MPLADIRALVATDFVKVDQIINKQLDTNVPLIKTICQHIINSGGKRLRPLLVLLIASALNYQQDKHHTLSVIIEFIHTATLLHDDVVDHSALRRGEQTANDIWGNGASVLVGDFLYSRAFQLINTIRNHDILEVLATTTNSIAEGEVMQLVQRNEPTTNENQYMTIIEGKTATLFEAAARMTAILANTNKTIQNAAGNFALHLGLAFQIADDMLDYVGDKDVIGKNVGDDLADGKATLPLIYAMQQASKEEANVIHDALKTGDIGRFEQIKTIIDKTNAVTYTQQQAKKQVELALSSLNEFPKSVFKEGLASLAQFAIQRKC